MCIKDSSKIGEKNGGPKEKWKEKTFGTNAEFNKAESLVSSILVCNEEGRHALK